jgi:hypothetical protein
MSCSKHDKVMFNIINSLEKTKFKFSWWKANNVSVTFTNTSLKCAIQIELNSIVERAERISGLETENQNSHFQTLRKKVMRHMLRSIGAQIEKTSANVSRPRKRQQNSKSCMWSHVMSCDVSRQCDVAIDGGAKKSSDIDDGANSDIAILWCCMWYHVETMWSHETMWCHVKTKAVEKLQLKVEIMINDQQTKPKKE